MDHMEGEKQCPFHLFCRTDCMLLCFRHSLSFLLVPPLFYNRSLSSQKNILHRRSFMLSNEGDLFFSTLDCIFFFSDFIVNASHCTPIMISILCENFKTSESVLSVSIFICLITVFPHRDRYYNTWEDEESTKSLCYSLSEVKIA